MTPAAKKKMAAHLAKFHGTRPGVCTTCQKKITLRGANCLPYCDPHKKIFKAERKQRRREERERKQRTGKKASLRSLPPADSASISLATDQLVRPTPEIARRGGSVETYRELAQAKETAGVRRATFQDAVNLITAPEARREGWRHGFIGNTGTGKTTAARAFLSNSLDAFTLIHDDAKLDAQYTGHGSRNVVIENFDDVPEAANIITLRGDAFRGTVIEVETVAELAIRIARATREPVRLVVDELDRATSNGGRSLDSPSLRVAFTQGRALGVSVLWLTQTPQRAPIEVVDQSSTIGLFQLGPRALNYLDERLCFDAELLAVVPTLAVGEFVIYEQGRPWNKTIYRTPDPS